MYFTIKHKFSSNSGDVTFTVMFLYKVLWHAGASCVSNGHILHLLLVMDRLFITKLC